ncbi:ribonuclease-like protein P complex subunit Pop1 [Dothidotthia symphoricarpi CBS 119687]|uniref:Ribonuclease-like protein P complex subunit Pop1 n=1 Tax=Dothidotthia symphoricarpi CBS 119687 TaxID=1392245 RepID=A0A6A6AHV1_9PLEO|nr:ribonuclease-like protein P complex subunit Pop1 [Dothidotthia symphoricarpi CBS 119687]KAF2131136.1 ribonuclease-like protein P complex subunit Pop1 [Dothidotthia symphoricarpi CBS 119687]
MADSSRKRKQTSDANPHSKRPRFPHRPQHHIPAQPTKTAYPNGEINVKNFLASHENEIKSLEGAMKAAKKGLARRAFQDVPRELRRRTASHNPQRVPKRLRVRARQEAKDDNTPISRGTSGSGVGKGKKKFLRNEGREKSRLVSEGRAKRRTEKGSGEESPGETGKHAAKPTTRPKPKPRFPVLATPATPASRFRRRQRDKTWLPTHIWHTKRSRMTDPKEPLWRFAIPLAPAVKSYRLTHRAASQRGAVAWDMSYMSTISLEGTEASILGLLKGLHFAADEAEDPWQVRGKGKKWRHGTRVWEGWIYEREAKPLKKVAHVAVIWCVPDADNSKRKAFIRVHPGAFLQLWNEVVRVAKMQRPAVTVQDLRFEIGSIELVGPAAAETLCSILSPTTSANAAPDAPHSLWSALASVTDVGSLPAGALLAFNITDPRLRDPPACTQIRQDEQSLQSLTETLAHWPIDNTQDSSLIFDRNARLLAARLMPSQKSINHRKGAESLGGYPEARATDPQIPMLLYVSRESRSWTVMLPWKCVLPVWRGIMRYPVSTGGNPRFGGLKERRQVDFERSVPSFPYDHPGTDAGWTWELREREARKHEWTKRPKGKRIEWSTIDLGGGRKGEVGDPWDCDWVKLLPSQINAPTSGKGSTESHSAFRQLSSHQVSAFIAGTSPPSNHLESPHLFTVKITMAQRGTTADCARVYRLPTNNVELRSKWLSLMSGPRPSSKAKGGLKKQNHVTSNAPEHVQRRELAAQLLQPTKAGDDDYPVVPDEEDLIGFITTGNYNLAEGMSTAVANLALHRVIGGEEGHGVQKERHICIVREAGRNIGRLATWEVV